MKLISFAVISLLAIVVSAHIPQSTFATNHAPPYSQGAVDAELARLMAAYEKEKEDLDAKVAELEKVNKEAEDLSLAMRDLRTKINKDGITEDRRSNLEGLYIYTNERFEEVYANLMAKSAGLSRATERRDDTNIKLLTLRENWDMLVKYNTENRVQMKALPGSYYSVDILEKQVDKACRHAKDLFTSNEKNKEGIYRLGKKSHITKDTDKATLHGILGGFNDSLQQLFEEAEFAKRRCSYTKGLWKDLTRHSLSLRAGRVYRSLGQKLKMRYQAHPSGDK
ncbi:hypothetical protein BASA50_010763 [Batrachochytrium salamandrivorans]|uniref:Uncharacterized protein n=1 Tax=Batrachochytrium salamandrivorans TaxID=1357716 RepID=A0ABQ8EXL4_9FUNG|nr:hypothetical protein BASA50_010763 [Batrachochytrium salamandrivorans]